MGKALEKVQHFIAEHKSDLAFTGLAGYIAAFLTPAVAMAASPQTVLQGIGDVATVGVGIVMIIFLVKNIAGYIKGNGSIGKVIGQTLIFLLFMGLILVATHTQQLQQLFSPVADNMVDLAANTATQTIK